MTFLQYFVGKTANKGPKSGPLIRVLTVIKNKILWKAMLNSIAYNL